jgi:transposase InsO family protein
LRILSGAGELIDRSTFRTRREARLAVFRWIEAWYNPLRRHSGIGRISPVNFERRSLYNPTAESANLSGKAG